MDEQIKITLELSKEEWRTLSNVLESAIVRARYVDGALNDAHFLAKIYEKVALKIQRSCFTLTKENQ